MQYLMTKGERFDRPWMFITLFLDVLYNVVNNLDPGTL